ncbi:hypothetical protein G7Y89_g2587 [Cudoniella acicularis]|uniref:Uncharacterized protein n=1 Tax=Cudoniella acicularis TaxID=354080 RepID=A0A8H4RT75_9HELO|nr:hypothetical protein G7Y89_g2587 [Cudoniella acicularis]
MSFYTTSFDWADDVIDAAENGTLDNTTDTYWWEMSLSSYGSYTDSGKNETTENNRNDDENSVGIDDEGIEDNREGEDDDLENDEENDDDEEDLADSGICMDMDETESTATEVKAFEEVEEDTEVTRPASPKEAFFQSTGVDYLTEALDELCISDSDSNDGVLDSNVLFNNSHFSSSGKNESNNGANGEYVYDEAYEEFRTSLDFGLRYFNKHLCNNAVRDPHEPATTSRPPPCRIYNALVVRNRLSFEDLHLPTTSFTNRMELQSQGVSVHEKHVEWKEKFLYIDPNGKREQRKYFSTPNVLVMCQESTKDFIVPNSWCYDPGEGEA